MSLKPNDDTTEFLFYCDMTALSPEQRIAHQNLISQLFGGLVQETSEPTASTMSTIRS
jgi:hypothetical protein